MPDTSDDNYERLAAALRRLNARLRVGGMTDEEAGRLPVQIDAETLRSFGNSTWMTDAGPLDLLVELRDEEGGRHPYAELVTRSVTHSVGGIVVRLASLDDIVASKEFADRPKDREALPELRELQRRGAPGVGGAPTLNLRSRRLDAVGRVPGRSRLLRRRSATTHRSRRRGR